MNIATTKKQPYVLLKQKIKNKAKKIGKGEGHRLKRDTGHGIK